jgi:hypothetical protein
VDVDNLLLQVGQQDIDDFGLAQWQARRQRLVNCSNFASDDLAP